MAKLTEAEARARAALIDVESYRIFLDLAAEPAMFRSHTEIRFRCGRPGNTTFADVSAFRLNRVVLNDMTLDPDAVPSAGRLRLPELKAHNVLNLDSRGAIWGRHGAAR